MCTCRRVVAGSTHELWRGFADVWEFLTAWVVEVGADPVLLEAAFFCGYHRGSWLPKTPSSVCLCHRNHIAPPPSPRSPRPTATQFAGGVAALTFPPVPRANIRTRAVGWIRCSSAVQGQAFDPRLPPNFRLVCPPETRVIHRAIKSDPGDALLAVAALCASVASTRLARQASEERILLCCECTG